MVLYPGSVRVTRSLRKTLGRGDYEVQVDREFRAVMRACADPRPGQDGTWITPRMLKAYALLHDLGHAHSVETWRNGELVGGLYGVAIGRAFFGESMFSRASDASKIALVHLAARLAYGGFRLLDTQFVTDHLRQFGTIELNREEFHRLLEQALELEADFRRLPLNADADTILSILDPAAPPRG
jgi:leucyl/phenylalanyl-tRNA--protein transferase